MPDIILTSPLCGWAAPLDEVPDAVFAERMLGDGIAVDPTGNCLHAPCDGTVVNIHAGRHAVTVRSVEGVEVLMHVGLDTVGLNGAGFHVHVTEGQTVARGDALIGLDLDQLVQSARAVMTPMIVTNPERFRIVRRDQDREVGIGQAVLWLTAATAEAEADAALPVTGDTARQTLVVPLVHGIHARPAARIGACARAFEADVLLVKGDRSANVRSAVGLLGLAIRLDDSIEIVATGPDAAAAVSAVADLISGGMGERAGEAPPPTPVAPPAPPPAPAVDGVLRGVTAAPGLALGRAGTLRIPEIVVPVDGQGVATETRRFDDALATVDAAIADRAATALSAQRAILSAHRAFLADPDLLSATRAAIAEGRDAGFAWRRAIRAQADILRGTGDARLAERADDLVDLERQLLRVLTGTVEQPVTFPPGTILIADDLLPSQVIGLDIAMVAGICVERGGPTSHVAILAATMGLPALVAVGPALRTVADGTRLLLDADAGTLTLDPDPATTDIAAARIETAQRNRAAARAAASETCRTADGVRIEAFANLGSADDAVIAVRNGAEGCGLLRTEFLFLERDSAPDETEQAEIYQAVADRLEGRPLIVRLLDIGGDKPAPYLPIPAEENPALGLRGIRVGFAHPDLLDAQLRAILRVAPIGQCRIMVPMIASLAELRQVRTALDRARAALGITDAVPLGVMIETPAAAITADIIAAEADFLSVGTNDLTQYALAMDRGNPAVAAGIDGLHPAVLRLIAQTTAGGAAHGRWTGVCGGLASDLAAVPILIGLGVTELSAAPGLVPDVKALVRTLDLARCRDHAAQALRLSSAADIRALAAAFRRDLQA